MMFKIIKLSVLFLFGISNVYAEKSMLANPDIDWSGLEEFGMNEALNSKATYRCIKIAENSLFNKHKDVVSDKEIHIHLYRKKINDLPITMANINGKKAQILINHQRFKIDSTVVDMPKLMSNNFSVTEGEIKVLRSGIFLDTTEFYNCMKVYK